MEPLSPQSRSPLARSPGLPNLNAPITAAIPVELPSQNKVINHIVDEINRFHRLIMQASVDDNPDLEEALMECRDTLKDLRSRREYQLTLDSQDKTSPMTLAHWNPNYMG